MYCIDDGVILRDLTHAENSIDEVARKCSQLLEQFLQQYYKRHGQIQSLILGGWSYGGVIAIHVAEIIKASNINLSGLILFDSPLTAPSSPSNIQVPNDDSSSTNDKVEQHFHYCTKLLQHYYQSQISNSSQSSSSIKLNCPILDLRAEHSTYQCDISVLEAFTTCRVERIITNGTHFTMLFNENSVSLANIILKFLFNL